MPAWGSHKVGNGAAASAGPSAYACARAGAHVSAPRHVALHTHLHARRIHPQAVVKEGVTGQVLVVKLTVEKPSKGSPHFARRMLGLADVTAPNPAAGAGAGTGQVGKLRRSAGEGGRLPRLAHARAVVAAALMQIRCLVAQSCSGAVVTGCLSEFVGLGACFDHVTANDDLDVCQLQSRPSKHTGPCRP